MSDWQNVCDAVIDDLTSNVPELAEAIEHRYAPWDPEALAASVGEIHLAVWPAGEASAEGVEPLATGTHQLSQAYQVLIWEQAGTEEGRGKVDEEAAVIWFDLHNAIRLRFYYEPNQMLGGANRLWYAGTDIQPKAGNVRYMLLGFEARFMSPFWTE